jgi:hypothetical protein
MAPEQILTCARVVRGATGQAVQVRWQNQGFEMKVERVLNDPYNLALLGV